MNALVPVFGKKALPQIYLQETKAAVPAVFLPESGDSGAGARFKWLVSTCLAGFVGVGVIGASVYASMNVGDGTGVVSSIKRASLAAMQPEWRMRAADEDQTVMGQKGDRIQETARGLATTQLIQDTVEQKVGGEGYLKIKRYGRVVARLATARPDVTHHIPAFNPFKLYSNPAPITADDDVESVANHEVTVRFVELAGGVLPAEDSLELSAPQVVKLVAESNELDTYAEGPYAMRGGILPDGARNFGLTDHHGLVQQAAYHPDQPLVAPPLERDVPPNTTIVEKSWNEQLEDIHQKTEVKSVTVKRGDTLMSILIDAGAESWQAKAIYEAMAPVFLAKSLQKGQEVRLTLAPAPGDTGQMEPIKVSLFNGKRHEVTIARNGAGDYVASDDPIDISTTADRGGYPKRATLYTSFLRCGPQSGPAFGHDRQGAADSFL